MRDFQSHDRALAEARWKAPPQGVTVPYAKAAGHAGRIPSTAGHEESRGNQGGPSPKAKYSCRPIVNKYREGKVKSTPGGE